MDTRQELEERLEIALSEIMSEVNSRKGSFFEGELSEAISLLKEAREILKQLNSDNYINDEDMDDDMRVSGKRSRLTDEEDDGLGWGDDYEDGY
jgi:hypothetical protein